MYLHLFLFPKANSSRRPSATTPTSLSTPDHRGAALILYDYYTLYAVLIYMCRRTKWWYQIGYLYYILYHGWLNFHRNRKIILYNLSNDFLFFFEDFENMCIPIVWRENNYFREEKKKSNWSVHKDVYNFQKNTKFTVIIQWKYNIYIYILLTQWLNILIAVDNHSPMSS